MTDTQAVPTGRIELRSFILFLSAAATAMVMSLIGYALAVDRAVPDSEMPGTYTWLLLKETPGQRLVIESGSNSHHGLDAKRMSDELGLTTINIADNGGYDIEDKIARLERYLVAGDTVLLPLEWSYYYRDEVTDNYFEAMFAGNRDYFNALGLRDRARRALTLPPRTFFTLANSAPKPEETPSVHDLFYTAALSPYGGTTRAWSLGPGPNVAEQSCDDYLFVFGYQDRGLTISNRYRGALKRLAKLRDKGVDVHLAWPAMAGEGCLTSSPDILAFKEAIEAQANALGLHYIDAVSNSVFDQSLQDDTPYHLITRGRDLRTTRMISALKQAGVSGSGETSDLGAFAYKRLYELEVLAAPRAELEPLSIGETLRTDDEASLAQLDFKAGWWTFEKYGRWMRDNRAVMSLVLPQNASQDSNLMLTGRTLQFEPQTLSVFYKGRLLKRDTFSETIPFILPTTGLPRAEPISLTFELTDAGAPQSPLMLGESQDARTMTIHLQTISLQERSTPVPIVKPESAPAPAPEQLPAPVILANQKVSEAVRPVFPTGKLAPSLSSELCVAATNISTSETALQIGEAILIGDPASQSKIKFEENWWDREPGGRWMSCCEATFTVGLPEDLAGDGVLRLYGDVFGGGDTEVAIQINEQATFTVVFRRDLPIEIPLPQSLSMDTLRVSLSVSDTMQESPKALGLGDDPRVLTIFLDTIELVKRRTSSGM